MSEDTWLDVGANIAELMRRWITGQASMDQSREFSPQQLLLLQELFKAGAVGMAEIVAKQLCALDTRITTMEQSPLNQCEATTLEHAAQEADASSASSGRTTSKSIVLGPHQSCERLIMGRPQILEEDLHGTAKAEGI